MFNGKISYTYDVLDNLQTVTKPGRLPLRYCYDGSNRLTFIRENTPNCTSGPSIASLGWDAQGNVRWKNEQDFGFNFDNRLREVTGVEVYRYDAHGRRVMSYSAQGLGNIFSMYSHDGVVRQISNARAKQSVEQYIYLAGSLVAVRATPIAGGAATVKYQHTDALGTPVAVTDANRNVLERNQYEPYGKLIGKTADDNPGYTGHVEDSATGLTYMQQRYYDPQVGRVLSIDPVTAVSNPTGYFGRYHYAANNGLVHVVVRLRLRPQRVPVHARLSRLQCHRRLRAQRWRGAADQQCARRTVASARSRACLRPWGSRHSRSPLRAKCRP